jgi:hypothetical protein
MALVRLTQDSTVLAPVAASLRGQQLANGSWGDDAYLTALALRALQALAILPPAPTTGSVHGQVIDSVSHLPLAGATVSLGGPSPQNTNTNSNGVFNFDNVAPGATGMG